MSSNLNPNLAKIQLGRFLKEYRLRAGLKPGDAEVVKIAKASKLKAIEAGRVQSFRYADILAFGSIYDVTRDELDNLTELQEASEKPGWYHQFDVLEAFTTFLTMESVASKLLIVEIEFITGLFQIPEYTNALREFNLENKGGADKGVKSERQELVLDGEQPPEIVYITSEAALKRQVGGRKVMKAQLEHLVTMSERPGIDILVLPFSLGPHHAMFGPFTIMYFDGGEFPTTVYLESIDGSRYEEGERFIKLYESVSDKTRKQAIPIKDYAHG
ncbi:helix-turn-helix domain-containing protein [Stackebrandtia nassauensis]|uniref:DUF5753 domain-containing protein n=1 Tax=Stackebrandtia nassauensis (strain DSM 44728 / CIP 108903 / NRRL B-16338 / NBRC 102104 / LLR-40K-21) TaxID=446470 RepID=D3PV15_STANL|nr:helix-turn-helix transcriptional regulator [Stackebrandtia nassauensis]ADD45039.1 hypothetical protein Snas_5407 [Stackebrandtia nassauensis DSM 44728]